MWVAAVGLLLAGCPLPRSTPTPHDYARSVEPLTDADYYVYVPSTYSDDRAWPLVVTLHGTNPWDTWTLQIKEWDSLAEERGFIVVAPKLKSPQGILPKIRSAWYDDLRLDEQKILSIMDQVAGKYNIAPDAVMLTGFSAGGYPMYWTGLRNPERFSMLVARACNSDVEMFETIDITEAARNLPIRIFWGRDDLDLIRRDSWAALAWLRNHHFTKATRAKIKGGHLRRPELAYDMWLPVLPDKYER